jgi:hypothetical protein
VSNEAKSQPPPSMRRFQFVALLVVAAPIEKSLRKSNFSASC